MNRDRTDTSQPGGPPLTAEAFMKTIERLKRLQRLRRSEEAIGVIWQPEHTEFRFLDGTRGFGSPYVEDRTKVYLIKTR